MACTHCLNARRAVKRAASAAIRGNARETLAQARIAISEIGQSDEGKRTRALLSREKE